jgi:hypothetical protein
MADLQKIYRHKPNILGRLNLDDGDITRLMVQESVLEGLKTEQLLSIAHAIEAQLCFRQMNGEVIAGRDEYAQEEASYD